MLGEVIKMLHFLFSTASTYRPGLYLCIFIYRRATRRRSGRDHTLMTDDILTLFLRPSTALNVCGTAGLNRLSPNKITKDFSSSSSSSQAVGFCYYFVQCSSRTS